VILLQSLLRSKTAFSMMRITFMLESGVSEHRIFCFQAPFCNLYIPHNIP